MKQKTPPNRSIEQHIQRLLNTVLPVMAAIIVILIIMLLSINGQYTNVLLSANTAADFNQEFKTQLDSGMYNHVIRPRSESSAEDLPMAVLEDAAAVLRRLENTTTLRDNRWRIQSMLDMCDNLRRYMIEIAREESYDLRMELLERNIRGETGLTKLIETYMNDFINDEVRELARLQRIITSQMTAVIIAVIAGVAVLTLGMVWYSVRVTRRITEPISALSRKARRFGEGNFSSEPLETHITELQTLNSGFDEMAGRITALIAKQREDQQSLHRAELELLQAQINPHFLYNTLDSIAILAESDRGEDVVNMVTSLSTFFRNSLNKGEDIISLAAERTQVTSYLEIQQIRYSDILRYDIRIPDELLDCQVPKLILQPLVENALYHGIKNRRGMGTITVTGETDGNDILLKVTDNGAGMDEEQVRVLQSGIYEDRHTGLGLVNVHKRIRLYCGEPYGLSFESQIGKGSTVTIRLPQTRPQPKEANEQ
ncbi:MAG: sensor histidine kinase [Clostridia bacterium]|nr:sensor histidine kinase [Clostridia bacterium]